MTVPVPPISLADLDDSIFQLPESLTNYDIVPLNNAALTTGTVGGDGTFDVVMGSISAHLKAEYDKNRITGAEYTQAYIALTQAALQASVQFLLGRDQAFWMAQKAQVDAIKARVDLEIARLQYGYLVPAQIALLQEQMEAARAQTLNTRSDGVTTVVGVLGKQKDLYTQQITSYQRDAETKVAKIFADAWIAQKTIDEGLVAPTGFTNASLDTVLTTIKTNNSLS